MTGIVRFGELNSVEDTAKLSLDIFLEVSILC